MASPVIFRRDHLGSLSFDPRRFSSLFPRYFENPSTKDESCEDKILDFSVSVSEVDFLKFHYTNDTIDVNWHEEVVGTKILIPTSYQGLIHRFQKSVILPNKSSNPNFKNKTSKKFKHMSRVSTIESQALPILDSKAELIFISFEPRKKSNYFFAPPPVLRWFPCPPAPVFPPPEVLAPPPELLAAALALRSPAAWARAAKEPAPTFWPPVFLTTSARLKKKVIVYTYLGWLNSSSIPLAHLLRRHVVWVKCSVLSKFEIEWRIVWDLESKYRYDVRSTYACEVCLGEGRRFYVHLWDKGSGNEVWGDVRGTGQSRWGVHD